MAALEVVNQSEASTTLAFTETEYVVASKMFVDGANTTEFGALKLIKFKVSDAGMY